MTISPVKVFVHLNLASGLGSRKSSRNSRHVKRRLLFRIKKGTR